MARIDVPSFSGAVQAACETTRPEVAPQTALSSQFGDRFNVLKLDGYGMLNAAVRYTRGPLEYAININNLTDTEYIASTLYDTQVYPGEPINVLGTVRVRFR